MIKFQRRHELRENVKQVKQMKIMKCFWMEFVYLESIFYKLIPEDHTQLNTGLSGQVVELQKDHQYIVHWRIDFTIRNCLLVRCWRGQRKPIWTV